MAGGDVRRLAVSSSPKLTPDEIASRSFAKAVRGVSEAEVRSFLSRVAEEVAAISEREDSLRSRIESLEEELRSPKAPTDQELLTALGEETARVLRREHVMMGGLLAHQCQVTRKNTKNPFWGFFVLFGF